MSLKVNELDRGDTHFHADMLTLCLENLVSAGMGAGEVLGVERSFSVAYLSDLNLSLRDAMPRAPIATLMVESEVSDKAFHVKIPEIRVTSRCEQGGCRRTSVHFLIFSGSCSSPFSQSYVDFRLFHSRRRLPIRVVLRDYRDPHWMVCVMFSGSLR